MNAVNYYTNLYSMMETAIEEDREDDFIRGLFSIACVMMWSKMSDETQRYVDRCSQEIRDHLEGKIDIWNFGKPRNETA